MNYQEISERSRERFNSHVNRAGTCHTWTGARGGFRGQYGVLTINAERWYAHRAAWVIVHGQIPDGLCVLHRCDNPPCVNPEHLFLGTNADNTNDMVVKGRARGGGLVGEMHGRSKLTESAVREIRERYSSGEPQRKLAAEFGVCKSVLARAVHGQTWKCVSA